MHYVPTFRIPISADALYAHGQTPYTPATHAYDQLMYGRQGPLHYAAVNDGQLAGEMSFYYPNHV